MEFWRAGKGDTVEYDVVCLERECSFSKKTLQPPPESISRRSVLKHHEGGYDTTAQDRTTIWTTAGAKTGHGDSTAREQAPVDDHIMLWS